MPAPSLSNSDLMDEYVASCVDLHRQWQRLLPAERRARIQDAFAWPPVARRCLISASTSAPWLAVGVSCRPSTGV